MSNPGRQSLLIPSTSRASTVITPEDTEGISTSITDHRMRTERASSSYSPSLIRRNINMTPTTAHCTRHSFTYNQHPSLSAARRSSHHADSNGPDQPGLMHY